VQFIREYLCRTSSYSPPIFLVYSHGLKDWKIAFKEGIVHRMRFGLFCVAWREERWWLGEGISRNDLLTHTLFHDHQAPTVLYLPSYKLISDIKWLNKQTLWPLVSKRAIQTDRPSEVSECRRK
jgi:hypothetical protein